VRAVIAAQNVAKRRCRDCQEAAAAGQINEPSWAEATLEQTRGRGSIDPAALEIEQLVMLEALTVGRGYKRTFIADLSSGLVSMRA